MQRLLPQLTLSLSSKDEATFEDFYAGKNTEIVTELKKVASGQGEKIIYLCAARGQGASHLLQAICHEIEAIAGHAQWEEAIFHLYNRVRDAGGRIIVAGHDLPKAINLQLPDLVSRLSWGVLYQLISLEDDEKLIALNMRAKRRGMTLPDDVGKYLLTHCPRHMSTLFAALDALDKASLAAQRRLTIPFVKEVLQI